VEFPGGVLLELRMPMSLGLGFARVRLAIIVPGLPPSAGRLAGQPPATLCLRTSGPHANPHPATVTLAPPAPGSASGRVASLTCGGGCSMALTLTLARAGAAVKTAFPPAQEDAPGGVYGPPLRPGLPDLGNRRAAMPELFSALGDLRLGVVGPADSRMDFATLPPCAVAGWGVAGGGGTPVPGAPAPALATRLAGLWKGVYGPHGPEVVALGRPGAGGSSGSGGMMGVGDVGEASWGRPAVAGRKVDGDANVPAGKVSFCVYDAAQDMPSGPGNDAFGPGSVSWAMRAMGVTPPDLRRGGGRPLVRALRAMGGLGRIDPPGLASEGGPRVAAAHPAMGCLAGTGFEDPHYVDAVLLELDGFSGPASVDAFVLVWIRSEPRMASLFVRVAEREVSG
jgi:hypothetical protein